MNKEKIKGWLKSKENQLLLLLMIFTIVIKLYYFFRLGNQPIWWDEGDYLAISKVWALGMEQPEWWAHFSGMRPLLMPIIWFLFMKISTGELVMRFFTLLIPSVITVWLVYAVGRDMYNKKIGLISAFIMSVYWVHNFYTFRLLTDIPALCLGMLTVYFFWSGYIKKRSKKSFYIAIFFGVLTFAARFPHASMLFTCFLFLLITEKIRFFRKKINYKALFFLLLCLSPYLIYFVITNFYAFFVYLGPVAASIKPSYINASREVFGLFQPLMGPNLPFYKNIFFIFMFIGIFSLSKLFLCFDIFWKQQDKRFNADFFVLLWIIIQLFIYIIVIRSANDRWLLMMMPALFFLVAKGFYITEKYLRKHSKYLAVFIIIALILLGGFYQLKHNHQLIEVKKNTYKEIKLAGEWLKENTPKDTKVITASIVQNQYYSERQSYGFYVNSTHNKTLFEEKVKKLKPDYLIVHVFEPGFTPEWAYTYPQEKNLQSIIGFPNNEQPLLVIYKF